MKQKENEILAKYPASSPQAKKLKLDQLLTSVSSNSYLSRKLWFVYS